MIKYDYIIKNNLIIAKYGNKRLQFEKLPVKQVKNNTLLQLKMPKFDMTAKTAKYGYKRLDSNKPPGAYSSQVIYTYIQLFWHSYQISGTINYNITLFQPV